MKAWPRNTGRASGYSLKAAALWLLAPALLFASGPVWTAESREGSQDQILQQLSELRKAQGNLSQQVTNLQARVQVLETAGKPPQASIDLRNDSYPVLGEKKADVAIVEFTDFECPYCRRYQKNTLPGITAKYLNGGKVKYVLVNFPLPFHPHAEAAAVAGACAAQQGGFWKMHEKLFENQSSLVPETFARLAAELGLKGDQFARCQQDPAVVAGIREQVRLGKSVGVHGTPTFLIGRVRDGILTDATLVSGAKALPIFEQLLDPLLAGEGAAK